MDDAQWLDAASAQTLGFVGRRLLTESVAIVFAVRDEPDVPALAGLPELPLGGLPEEHARDLLSTVIPGRLDDRLRDRIIAETRGNPLALLELPHDLAATKVPVGRARVPAQPLSGRIEGSFRQRLERLTPESRRCSPRESLRDCVRAGCAPTMRWCARSSPTCPAPCTAVPATRIGRWSG